MKLADLIQHLSLAHHDGSTNQNLDIVNIHLDSRHIKPGDLFVALPSASGGPDGTEFISQAIAQGAVVVLGPKKATEQWSEKICYLPSADVQNDLAKLLPLFYPKTPQNIVAVTGTNGKTQTVRFCQQLWAASDLHAASLGTLGVDAYPDLHTLTSPDPVSLHRLLQQLAQDRYTHVALEASSHGLEQRRLAGVHLKAAAFTNLSHDHLDYHKTFEAYFKAKQRLFQELLPEGAVAVLNVDVPEFPELVRMCKSRGHTIVTYSTQTLADIVVTQNQAIPSGQQLQLDLFGKRYDILLPLVGKFQVANALCALGLVSATGIAIKDAVAGLATLQPIRGRLEHVATTTTGAQVFVDYAHTPAALQTVLAALRSHTPGRLILVFGCGGGRDQQKRPIMGNVAAQAADLVFVTDDNPRSEVAADIRAAILQRCPEATEIGDRKLAIHTALEAAKPGDVVLIAGKGHEAGQIVGSDVLPFNDADVVRRLGSGNV